jgi:hypothetical protein
MSAKFLHGPWPRAAVVAACITLAVPPGTAQPSGAPLVTRQGQAVQQLEESLLRAQREKDRSQIERLLDGDFEMIVAQDPGNPVDREGWIDSATRQGAGAWEVGQISVRDLGVVAIASFVLRPGAGRSRTPPVFIVDVWQHGDAPWRLLRRHAALVLGSRHDIPGDSVPTTIPKKY